MARPDVPAMISGGSLRRHMVTVPQRLGQPVGGEDRAEAELRAHGMDELDGHDGGAVTPRRSDERSCEARPGSASSVW